jgi:hypothetical protein
MEILRNTRVRVTDLLFIVARYELFLTRNFNNWHSLLVCLREPNGYYSHSNRILTLYSVWVQNFWEQFCWSAEAQGTVSQHGKYNFWCAECSNEALTLRLKEMSSMSLKRQHWFGTVLIYLNCPQSSRGIAVIQLLYSQSRDPGSSPRKSILINVSYYFYISSLLYKLSSLPSASLR